MRRTVVIAAAGVLAGCSSMSCGASQEKLGQLKLGMSRDEAGALMGCPGKQVSENGSYVTVEWSGPDSLLMSRTYVVFLSGRVFTYSIENRGGF